MSEYTYKLRKQPEITAIQFTDTQGEHWYDVIGFVAMLDTQLEKIPGSTTQVLLRDSDGIGYWVAEGDFIVARDGHFFEVLDEHTFNRLYEYEGE